MKHVYNFDEFLKEDGGVANATAGNSGGMGAIVAPQPSAIPGDAAGSTIGSGDIAATSGVYTKTLKDIYYPKKKKKGEKRFNIMKFSDKI
jgi:hypothetical protein